MNKISISTNMDSSENLIYEDSSCRVICNVSDFRDTTWWVTIIIIIDKAKNKSVVLTSEKLLEAYRRIALEVGKHGTGEIYTTKFGFIKNVKDIELKRPLL